MLFFWEFLNSEELNSVLSGYFCKVFQALVGARPRAVFQHVYGQVVIFEKLLKHLYQPAVCEVFSRLLNFNQ